MHLLLNTRNTLLILFTFVFLFICLFDVCLFGFFTQDFSGQGGSEPGTLIFVLDVISKVGCALSIGALGLTLLIFILSS